MKKAMVKKITTTNENISTTFSERARAFSNVLSLISDENVKQLCVALIENADDYFFTVPASSSGKYHPDYARGEGGLMRHSMAVAMILNEILRTDMFDFSEYEKDLLICAAIVHDIKKQGNNSHGHTVKEHPECAVEYINKIASEVTYLPPEDIKYICDAVISHMGKWGEEKPKTEAQKIVHIADCLASRKFITVNFDTSESINTDKLLKEEEMPPGSYVMPFGKHKGTRLSEVPASYLNWLVTGFSHPSHLAVRYAIKYLNSLKND